MSSSLGKSALRSSLATTSMNMVNLATGLLLTPFVMASLGDTQNGYWVIIKMVIGYYGFIDLGISMAIARFMAVALGRGDKEQAVRIVQTGLSFVLLLDVLLLVLLVAASLFMPQLTAAEEARAIRQLFLIAGVGMLMSLPGRIYMGILRANVRQDIISWQTIANNLLRAGAVYVVLKMGFGIISLTTISSVALVVLSVSFYFSARRLMPEATRFAPRLDRSILKDLFGYGSALTMASLGDVFRWSSAPVIAAVFCGPVFVTHLNIALSLSRYGTACAAGFFSVLMPVFGQLFGAGDSVRLKRVFYKTLHMTITTAGLIFGGLLFLGDDFIRNWVGAEYLDANIALICMTVGLMVALMQNPVVTLMQGLGLAKWYAISNGIEAGLNVLLCLLLHKMGMLGFGLAFMIPMLLVKLTLQPILILRKAGWSFWEYYFRFFKHVARCMVGVALAGITADRIVTFSDGWSGFLVKGIVYVAVYGSFVAAVAFSVEERKDLIDRIVQLVVPGK